MAFNAREILRILTVGRFEVRAIMRHMIKVQTATSVEWIAEEFRVAAAQTGKRRRVASLALAVRGIDQFRGIASVLLVARGACYRLV
jgi:hypothetical protein